MQNNKLDKKQSNVILGIDPGSTVIGYGIIRYENKRQKPDVLDYGYLDLKGWSKQEEKLLHLNKDLKQIFRKYKPSYIAIETIYFFKMLKLLQQFQKLKESSC